MEFQNPQYLVETDWLHAHLEDANLRVLDCTVYLPNYFDASAAQKLEIVSGRAHWEQAHIPGSAFGHARPVPYAVGGAVRGGHVTVWRGRGHSRGAL